MVRVRGSQCGNVPLQARWETHNRLLLFFIISLLMCGVIGGVIFRISYSLFYSVYRPYRLESHGIEWWWTVGPIIIVFMVALPTLVSLYWGGAQYISPLVSVMAIGHQWYWEYCQIYNKQRYRVDSYTDIRPRGDGCPRLFSTDANLLIPAFVPVRILVSSADVIHNFNLKSLMVSIDAVPGRCHSTVVNINRIGLFSGLCSEVCGPGHYSIALSVEVVPLYVFKLFFSE